MTNGIILSLVNNGIYNITTNTFPVDVEGNKAAYRIYKFKKAVEAAFKNFCEMEQGLLKECGIEDVASFNKRSDELGNKIDKTDEEAKELEEMTVTSEKYIGRQNELYAEECKMDILPISWDMWRMLIAENKDVKILSDLEPILEGILWEAPTE